MIWEWYWSHREWYENFSFGEDVSACTPESLVYEYKALLPQPPVEELECPERRNIVRVKSFTSISKSNTVIAFRELTTDPQYHSHCAYHNPVLVFLGVGDEGIVNKRPLPVHLLLQQMVPERNSVRKKASCVLYSSWQICAIIGWFEDLMYQRCRYKVKTRREETARPTATPPNRTLIFYFSPLFRVLTEEEMNRNTL